MPVSFPSGWQPVRYELLSSVSSFQGSYTAAVAYQQDIIPGIERRNPVTQNMINGFVVF
jgi:hypothetical protein